MQTIKLAEALLRRKELAAKLEQLKTIKVDALFQTKVKRAKVTDEIEDIAMQVPVLSASQVTAEFDFYARQQRLIDAAIQQANWTVDITVDDKAVAEYVAPELTRKGLASADR